MAMATACKIQGKFIFLVLLIHDDFDLIMHSL